MKSMENELRDTKIKEKQFGLMFACWLRLAGNEINTTMPIAGARILILQSVLSPASSFLQIHVVKHTIALHGMIKILSVYWYEN